MTYGSRTTAKYKQRVTAAEAGGKQIEFKSFVLGDGNGAIPTLGAIEAHGIARQVYAAPILSASINPGNVQQLDITCPVPAVDGDGHAIGPFWIREVAILDENDDIVCVANTQLEKTTAANGQVSSFNLKVSVAIADDDPVIVTPATVYATSNDITEIDAALASFLAALAQADQTIIKQQGVTLRQGAVITELQRQIAVLARALNIIL